MSPKLRYPGHAPRRATVIGAGSFGTAVALLLERAGVRTTLLCRTAEQAAAAARPTARTATTCPRCRCPRG